MVKGQAQKPSKPKLDPALTIPLLKAGGVHIMLFIFLFVSFHGPQQAEVIEVSISPKPIQARAISSEEVKKLVDNKKKKQQDALRAEQQRKDRLKKKREDRRKAEQDKKRKAEQAKKRKADEDKKRKADELKKQQEDARKKREAEELARKKREEEAARKRAEEQARIDEANSKRVLSEVGKYTALIKSKVRRNWIVNDQTGQCILEVRLASSGLILDVKEVKGDATSCRSAKAAVYKSEPLPVSPDSAVFSKMRVLRLNLDPQDS